MQRAVLEHRIRQGEKLQPPSFWHNEHRWESFEKNDTDVFYTNLALSRDKEHIELMKLDFPI